MNTNLLSAPACQVEVVTTITCPPHCTEDHAGRRPVEDNSHAGALHALEVATDGGEVVSVLEAEIVSYGRPNGSPEAPHAYVSGPDSDLSLELDVEGLGALAAKVTAYGEELARLRDELAGATAWHRRLEAERAEWAAEAERAAEQARAAADRLGSVRRRLMAVLAGG